jgi:tRNA1Val (adenine37-N6)-methyltransferase
VANNYFTFKHFTVYQDKCAFKVGTDGVLLGAYADISSAQRILDIGTGSGLIALMLAQRSNAIITAVEPDRESYQQACSNVENSDWKDRISVVNSRIQDFFPGNGKFDLIVTNPPFFTDSLKNPDTQKASARHNHDLPNSELLSSVERLLSDSGKFQLILPYPEANVFIADAALSGLYCNDTLRIRPLPASEIRRLILKFSRTRSTHTERFLTIEHGKRHEFTDNYKELTGDFYLRF